MNTAFELRPKLVIQDTDNVENVDTRQYKNPTSIKPSVNVASVLTPAHSTPLRYVETATKIYRPLSHLLFLILKLFLVRRKAVNEQKELKLLLDMYKGVSKEQRDKVQLMAAERRARLELDEHRQKAKMAQVTHHMVSDNIVVQFIHFMCNITIFLLE